MLKGCLSVYINIVQNMNAKKRLTFINSGKRINFTHIQHLTKMETPNKHNVRATSNTLKKALTDSNYVKALEKMIKVYKNAIKNGLY